MQKHPTTTEGARPPSDNKKDPFPVRQWDKATVPSLEREVEERELDIDVSGFAMAQALYREDSQDAETKIKMIYPSWAKKGMSKKDMEEEIGRYKTQSDLSYKLQQQALIANFVEEFDTNVKNWKSGGSTFNLIRSKLGLPKSDMHKKPELKYPESHFTIVKKPPRVHYKKKRGAVDEDEVPVFPPPKPWPNPKGSKDQIPPQNSGDNVGAMPVDTEKAVSGEGTGTKESKRQRSDEDLVARKRTRFD